MKTSEKIIIFLFLLSIFSTNAVVDVAIGALVKKCLVENGISSSISLVSDIAKSIFEKVIQVKDGETTTKIEESSKVLNVTSTVTENLTMFEKKTEMTYSTNDEDLKVSNT